MTQKTVISLSILFSIALHVSGANAQNAVSDSGRHPECRTNSGIPGVLFQGHFGTLTAPRNFNGAALDDENGSAGNGHIEILQDVRYGQDVLVLAYPNADLERKTTVYFNDAFGRLKSSCDVSVIPFDADEHDFAGTSLGYCQFGQRTGPSSLAAGQSEVFDLPEEYREGATSPREILGHSPEYGARGVRLTAGSEGYATFVWMGEDRGNGMLRGLCPFVVSDGS